MKNKILTGMLLLSVFLAFSGVREALACVKKDYDVLIRYVSVDFFETRGGPCANQAYKFGAVDLKYDKLNGTGNKDSDEKMVWEKVKENWVIRNENYESNRVYRDDQAYVLNNSYGFNKVKDVYKTKTAYDNFRTPEEFNEIHYKGAVDPSKIDDCDVESQYIMKGYGINEKVMDKPENFDGYQVYTVYYRMTLGDLGIYAEPPSSENMSREM